VSSYSAVLDEVLCSSQRYPANSEASEEASNFAAPSSSPSLHQEGSVRGESEGKRVSDSQSELFCWNMSTSDDDWQNNAVKQHPEELFVDFESEEPFHDLSPGCLDHTSGAIQRFEDRSSTSFFESTTPGGRHSGHTHSTAPGFNQRRRSQREVCIASNDTASEYARSTMTQNLIRIYHDSMENALSCWLTEHNCPYSDPISDVLHYRERKEWGPSWSNRMCIRVCRLDRASAAIRGRALSAEEDRTAARALHLAIIAFASQWSQHAQKGIGLSVPAPFSHDERSIRENIWNKARHALEHAARIPSFRIIFANIIFSLTQSPLDNEEDRHLGQLLEDDNAPVFLETANRQLFTFRHKFTRLQRECPPDVRELRRGSVGSTMTDMFEMPHSSETARVDQILASYEYRSTLGLLFWLGIMFDTLSAAMYQRPLVVSDEDSQIASASTSALDSEDQVDLDGWDILRNGARKRQDVWGDFFLCHLFEHQESGQVEPRWPCSYEYAASILSEATPVKVLLYRRVTQLQTLVYRGAGHDCLEDVIQKTIMVYQYWNCTYQRFMLDCVANHELLPPRIQSWYVILDGHWHLAAMLLADVIESIDHGRLGSDTQREARQAGAFVSTLRKHNALAVGALARSSLSRQGSTMHRHFHDSLNEVAFLVEPWTVVLIHAFAKAGYICLENLDSPDEQNSLSECFLRNCEFCICALQYLGRKSDMAFLVARNISRSLHLKLSQR